MTTTNYINKHDHLIMDNMDKTINTSITIRESQLSWVVKKRNKGEFNLSRFVQNKLDDMMKRDLKCKKKI